MQSMPNPVALPVTVDTTGAKILEGSVAEHDSRDIYLPNHVETVSHIAIDVGGSLAKVVYFTRIARPTATPTHSTHDAALGSTGSGSSMQAAAEGMQSSTVTKPLQTAAAHALPNWGARSPASPSSANGSRMHSRESSANVAQAEFVAANAKLNDDQLPSASIRRSRSNVSHGGSHMAQTADGSFAVPAGTLTPTSLFTSPGNQVSASAIHSHFMKRRSLPSQLPGGRLNFVKFETEKIDSCVNFLRELISLSAKANNVSLAQMRKGVKLMATGGGAHLFNDLFEEELGIEVRKEDEMQCLITGLNFITLIPDETFYYSDELVDNLSATAPSVLTKRLDASSSLSVNGSSPLPSSRSSSSSSSSPTREQLHLPRPSPDPPLYSPVFDSNPLPKLPCLLVNIGSGVSIIKVDEDGKFERVSGTSLGGGTLWGLLSLVTDAESFDEMLEMASRGDNGTVDMLVSDVYGASDALNNLGLKSTTIASSFGKVFRKEKSDRGKGSRGEAREERRRKFSQEDICKSLLYAISNNIGQIAYMNAEKFGLDRIYFGGCFIRGHPATIATLSYAIRFWSKGSKRAFFLRHEGYLGALGAWIRQFYDSNGTPSTPLSPGTPIPTAQAAAHFALKELMGSAEKQSTHPTSLQATSSTAFADGTTSTPASKLVRQEEESDSKNATPRGHGAQSQAMTPSLSRQLSDPFNTYHRPSAVKRDGLNPILAEALGDAEACPESNGLTASGHRPVDDFGGINVTHEDVKTAHDSLGGDTSLLSREEETAELSKLLTSLSEEDRQLFSELAAMQRGEDDGRTTGETRSSGDEDVESIAELLKKMDVMSGAADGLEGKLDGLLSRLDTILQEAEQDHTTIAREQS